MRPLTRSLVALSVSLVLISAGSVSASPVPSAYIRPLAGLTRVSSEGAGFARVSLARDVTVSDIPFESETIHIDSEASFAAVVLKEDVEKGGAEFLSYRIERCVEMPCGVRPMRFSTTYDPGQKWHREMVLPAGDYFLYAISDGAPVRATLRFDELEGTTSFPLGPGAVGEAGSLDPYLQRSDPSWSFNAAADHKIGAMGVSMVGIVLELKDVSEGEMETCFSEDPAGVEVPRPTAQTCLLSGGGSTGWGGGRMQRVVMLSYHLTAEGDYTHSLNYRGPTGVKASRAFHFVLDYGSGVRRGGLSGGASSGSR